MEVSGREMKKTEMERKPRGEVGRGAKEERSRGRQER
jgi:hypothetical protein